MKIKILVGFWIVLITGSFAFAQDLPAFPGAEGPGANASGGRAGDVYHVTNLDDYHPSGQDTPIPGSLRYGLETAPSQGRTIVFDIAGIINLVPDVHKSTHTWLRSGNDNITIAGQTAPYPGITIIGQGAKFSGSNWVVRNLKIRPGLDQTRPQNLTNDGISNNLRHSIIDHVSISWADDEGLSSTDAVYNSTVQYCIIGEGLKYSGHAFGALISSENGGAPLSYHHNLFVHNNSRNPRVGNENSSGAILNFSNNVIYNWSGRAAYSIEGKPSRTNFLSNYYIAGNSTASSDYVFYSPDTLTVIYHDDKNYVDMNKDGDIDGSLFLFQSPHFQGTATLMSPSRSRSPKPFEVASGHIQSAGDAVDQVLDCVGAFWWDRDPIDLRLIQDVNEGTGNHIDYISEAPQDPNTSYDAEGFPIYGVIQREADFDVDADGMADAWELDHGLDPEVDDHAGDFDTDGYTNLEEYLNDLAVFPAPTTITWLGGDGRYAEIQNWGISQTIPDESTTYWQPSRLDSAQIIDGTVTVDAVGQHAGRLSLTPADGNQVELQVNAGWLCIEEALTIGNDTNGEALVSLVGGRLTMPVITEEENGSFQLSGGVLEVNEVQFGLLNEGATLAASSTSIDGHYTQLAGGILQIEIRSASDFSTLNVNGQAQLAGLVNVVLSRGFTPAPGDVFLVISATTLIDQGLALALGEDNEQFELHIDTDAGVVQLLPRNDG